MPVVVVVVVVVVVAAVVVLLIRRREPNTLDSFQRQIDALSPEARRTVVDQVNQAADDASDHTVSDNDVGDVGDENTVTDETGTPDENEGRPDGT